MKIWRFYLKPDKDNKNKHYDLYAITNKKEYAKHFMKTRDMKRFIVKCSKDDKETYRDFANENRAQVLDEHELVTKTVNKNGLYGSTKVDFIMTEAEYQTCNGDEFMDVNIDTESFWEERECLPPKVFKDKIKDALIYLEYGSHYSIFNANKLDDIDMDEIYAPDRWVDEVGAFINSYFYTFK